MNAGQMLVQMPAGAMLNGSTAVSSPAASTSTGAQDAGAFAGILGGLAAQGAVSASILPETARPVSTAISAGNRFTAVKDAARASQETMPDLVASLLAAAGVALPTLAVVTGAEEQSHETSGDHQQIEVKMLQNVETSAAAAQVSLAAQIDGRMPASELKSGLQDSHQQQTEQIHQAETTDVSPLLRQVSSGEAVAVKLTEIQVPQNVETSAAAAQVILAAQIDGRMPASELKSGLQNSHQQQTQQIHQTETTDASPLLMQVSSGEAVAVELAEVQVPQNVKPSSAEPQIILTPQFIGRMPASEQKSISQDSNNEQAVSVLEKVQMQPAQAAVVGMQVAPDVKTAADPAENVVKIAIAKPQQSGGAVNREHASIESEQAKTVSVETPESAPVLKTAEVGLENPAARQAVAKSEAVNVIALIRQGDVELLDAKTSQVPVLPAASADKHVPTSPGGFRFSRSAAVDVALGNGQQVSERISEKSENGSTGNLRVFASKQPEVMAAASGESSSAFSGQDFAGFMQQTPQGTHPVVQHVSAVQQPFMVETAAATPLQPVQAEPSRLEVQGNIAGQVRERLASHDIKAGSDQIVFRLSPENLGDIKVSLKLDDQRLRVEIVAENRMAREGLLQHVDSLKESLSRQNITIDKFTVTSGGSQAGSQGDGSAQGEWRELARNRQSQQWQNSGGYRIPSAELNPARPVQLSGREHAMLDLHF